MYLLSLNVSVKRWLPQELPCCPAIDATTCCEYKLVTAARIPFCLVSRRLVQLLNSGTIFCLMHSTSYVNPAGDSWDTSPQMSDGEGTVMHHVPPNMAEISLHKRQRIRLYLLNYVIGLFCLI